MGLLLLPTVNNRRNPFCISYGSNAMITIEVGEPSLQNVHFIEEKNNKMLKEALDLAEETIKEVHMRAELYKRRAEKRYNNKVKLRSFLKGDLVLRKSREA